MSDDLYDDDDLDEYAPLEEQDGPGLFDDFAQDGPGLFDEQLDEARTGAPSGERADDVPGIGEASDDDAEASFPVVDEGDEDAAELIEQQPDAEVEPASELEKLADDAAETPVVAEAAQLALYRRYRPDTFAEVIGQEHVTEPLQRALANNRVNHAYLFSGPRGCGKTTSARILARCLNCVEGPTPTPCGVCDSCRDLARGGPGSIDVIEIDAASHGGVDDARDLRERAFFAPVNSRYKVYIVDEAHMVTTAGFNAMLKLVEEPPPHVKFIFATTEPEKVIGTIRSRTHHYPFRLVPPKVLTDYLGRLCEAEGVQVDATVLPLVVRAGAGSVRDSLSVLDQLLGGAGEEGIGYTQAAALLGYTPDALLDEIVDAFAAGDASGVFRTIDKVIEVGQDPRRFGEDLLRRLRDLVIIAAVPDAAQTGLLDVSDDQAQRLTTQAAGLGAGELTRAAEVIATGLTDMRGTTAPRLHLELMCARVLLPGADTDERGLHARIDRLERRVGMIGDPQPPAQWGDVDRPAAPQPPAQNPQPGQASNHDPAQPPAEDAAARPERPGVPRQRPAGQRARAADAEPSQPEAPRQRPAGQRPPRRDQAGEATPPPDPYDDAPPADAFAGPLLTERPQQRPQPPTPQPQQPQPQQPRPEQPAQQAGGVRPVDVAHLTAAELRRIWPQVLDEVKERRRYTWMLLSQHAQVADVSDGALTLSFANSGARDSFGSRGSSDILRDVLVTIIGVDLRIEAVHAGEADAEAAPRGGVRQRPAGEPAAPAPPPAHHSDPKDAAIPDEDTVSLDDETLTDEALSSEELITRELGGEVIASEEL